MKRDYDLKRILKLSYCKKKIIHEARMLVLQKPPKLQYKLHSPSCSSVLAIFLVKKLLFQTLGDLKLQEVVDLN